jgi:putative PIN family toxin of toxin-antitoxin system
MSLPKIIIDTNVVLSGLRSKLGASYRLLELIPKEKFEFYISPALILEYEDVLKRNSGVDIKQSESEIDDILDYLCLVGEHAKIYYLWRPQLKDPADDMILELAVASGVKQIITFNIKDFEQAKSFGITPMPPRQFLKKIGEIS